MKRIDSIQILRGIGAILILLFHLSFINRGEFAVDIFFCISGFILMYTTQKNTDHMLLKRLIRILPLYYIVTFVMFFIIKIIPSLALMSSANVSYLIKSLFFIPYVSMGADSNNYVVPLVSIGWTLNLEMYFYLIFTLANKISNKNRGLITSIILIIVALIGFVVNCNNLIFKFITNSVILEFVFGIAFFYIYKKLESYSINKNWKRISFYIILLGLLALLVAYFLGIPFLNIIYNIKLNDYLKELLIIITGATFFGVCYFISNVLIVLEKNFSQAIIYTFVAIFSKILSSFLVSKIGILGACLTYLVTMFTLFITYIILFLIYTKNCGGKNEK